MGPHCLVMGAKGKRQGVVAQEHNRKAVTASATQYRTHQRNVRKAERGTRPKGSSHVPFGTPQWVGSPGQSIELGTPTVLS
jgi:hypothetical protein